MHVGNLEIQEKNKCNRFLLLKFTTSTVFIILHEVYMFENNYKDIQFYKYILQKIQFPSQGHYLYLILHYLNVFIFFTSFFIFIILNF